MSAGSKEIAISRHRKSSMSAGSDIPPGLQVRANAREAVRINRGQYAQIATGALGLGGSGGRSAVEGRRCRYNATSCAGLLHAQPLSTGNGRMHS